MDWGSPANGILGGIIGSVLISVFAWSRSWISLSWNKYSRDRLLQKRLQQAVLNNFFASRDDFIKYRGATHLVDYLSSARRSIHIASYRMAHGTE